MRIETKLMRRRFASAEDYDVVLSLCSGGKDSLVSCFLCSQMVDPEKVYVLYYSGPWDFPGTRELVEGFCSERGLNLIVTSPAVDVDRFCVSYGPPNFKSRWCVSKIKKDPARKVLKMFRGKRVLFVDGIRHEESLRRSMLPVFEEKKYNRRDVLHPIFDWSEKRVWAVMNFFGLPIHPVYRWSGRLSCYCCPLQSDSAWLSLRRFYPDLFQRVLGLEEMCGKPFRSGYQFLRDLEDPPVNGGLEEPCVIALGGER